MVFVGLLQGVSRRVCVVSAGRCRGIYNFNIRFFLYIGIPNLGYLADDVFLHAFFTFSR